MEESDVQDISNSNIEDLPNELLLRVIQKVDHKNLSNATLVSKRWYAIINETIGRRMFVGRQCQMVPQDEDRYLHTYVDIFEISKIGVSECFVGEVAEPTRSMTLWSRWISTIKKTLFSESFNPEFKYPFLLKSLHFDGPIPDPYFESMIKDTANLNRLELHMTAFCNLKADCLAGLGQKWKHLEELSIWGHKLTDGLFTDFYDTKGIIPNLVVFLSNNFRVLSYFALEYPFDIRDDRKLTQEVFSFLKRHTKLTTMRTCVNVPISEEGSEFDSFEDREWTRESRSVSRQLNLNNLELIVSSMRRVRLTKVWMTVVENQRYLETATILSFRIPSHVLSNICENNKDYLKKLFISRILMTNTNNRPVQLDASIFTPCSKLTNLTVEGMLHSTTAAGLISTRLLPKTLVNLEIGGMLLLHSDAHDLFFELPNLTTICLTDIGNRDLFGITIETIQEIIQDKRIETITVYRCVCGTFPATGIHNGDPNSQTFIKLRPYEILELKLNAEGFYENMFRQSLYEEEFDDD